MGEDELLEHQLARMHARARGLFEELRSLAAYHDQVPRRNREWKAKAKLEMDLAHQRLTEFANRVHEFRERHGL